jgi:signal transduction histidine kinase
MANCADGREALNNEIVGDHDGFYADLADGLHAMAQPLTILRSAIAMLSLSTDDGASRRRSLEVSARQIERACRLFASIQDLVVSRLEPARRVPIDLEAILSGVLEERTAAFRERGVEIVAPHSGSPTSLLGDAQRTAQAISALLETALNVSSPGDKIEIGIIRRSQFVELIVAGVNQQLRRLTSADWLSLSVVKAEIRSQQGRYQFTDEPFRVTLSLPVRQREPDREASLSTTNAN